MPLPPTSPPPALKCTPASDLPTLLPFPAGLECSPAPGALSTLRQAGRRRSGSRCFRCRSSARLPISLGEAAAAGGAPSRPATTCVLRHRTRGRSPLALPSSGPAGDGTARPSLHPRGIGPHATGGCAAGGRRGLHPYGGRPGLHRYRRSRLDRGHDGRRRRYRRRGGEGTGAGAGGCGGPRSGGASPGSGTVRPPAGRPAHPPVPSSLHSARPSSTHSACPSSSSS